MTTMLTNATLVTVDADDTVIHDGALVIDGGKIASVGPRAEVTADPRWHTADVIDLDGAIVHPGLINAHTHLAMTMFRGYADDLDLQGFLDKLMPAEAQLLDAANVRAGSLLAIAESLRAGCTAALDMFWWPEETAALAHLHGFALGAGPVFVGFPGPDTMDFATRVAWCDERLTSAHDKWVMPHSTYTLEPDHLRQIAALADRHGARIHVHASENQAEVDMVCDRHGASPIKVLADTGLLSDRSVLAHAVALSGDDIALIATRGSSVVHCPMSNLKLASGVSPVPELLDAGVTIALGTDGCASSNDLDLYAAMRLAAVLHKGVRRDATVLPASTVLRMATINGATVMGRSGDLGSLEAGKRADVVVLDPSSLALTPSYDPIGSIVYAASRADVRDVWCVGHRVVRDGRLQGFDIRAIRNDVQELARRIDH